MEGMEMKKSLILLLVGGLLIGTSTGVFAEELIPLPEMVETGVVETMDVQADTLETNALPTYPSSYPADYYMYTTDAPVDGAGCYEMVERVNALRVSLGLNPLVLDTSLTNCAMYRASEINLVYLHSAPAGGIGQPDYTYFGDTENIVIGRNNGVEAYSAFEGSGGHYMNMTAPYWTRIGVGNYGSGWVLMLGGNRKGEINLSKDQLISNYTTSSRVIRTVVDQTLADANNNDGYNDCYNPRPVVNSGYDQSTSITLDKGVSQQMKVFVVCHPFEAIYKRLEVKIVPSSVPWKSSNPSVASVDSNGVVTGKTAGTTTVSCVVGKTTLTYNITVSNNGTTPVDIGTDYLVKYRTHVQNVGWQAFVADGNMAGTSGRSFRLEGINIDLNDNIVGGIEYRTHVQNIGWQDYVANSVMSGTSGRSYRLEAINIRLTGEAAQKYDIYYRVHTQNIGWMGWAKNDEPAGSAGFGYRLEGIEIKLVEKGGAAPGSTANAFVENK